jgi:hypothetical protein
MTSYRLEVVGGRGLLPVLNHGVGPKATEMLSGSEGGGNLAVRVLKCNDQER